MTLIHSTHLAIHYIGSKGRKVAWTEEWDKLDTYIPKFRALDQPTSTPTKSKYHDQIKNYQDRLNGGEELIEIQSDEPSRLRERLHRASRKIAPELKFITNTKHGTVTVLKRK